MDVTLREGITFVLQHEHFLVLRKLDERRWECLCLEDGGTFDLPHWMLRMLMTLQPEESA